MTTTVLELDNRGVEASLGQVPHPVLFWYEETVQVTGCDPAGPYPVIGEFEQFWGSKPLYLPDIDAFASDLGGRIAQETQTDVEQVLQQIGSLVDELLRLKRSADSEPGRDEKTAPFVPVATGRGGKGPKGGSQNGHPVGGKRKAR